jgi:uncharacterized protein YggE
MTGHGEIRAVPDMAQVTAGVMTTATSAAQALAANSTRRTGVFAALEKLGVSEKNIQTTSFFVSPQHAIGDNNGPRHLTGFQGNNEVSVRLEDVGKLGTALDALVGASANQMWNQLLDPQYRAAAGKRPHCGGYRRACAFRDLCQGSGCQPGTDPFHQRKRQ